MTDLTQPVLLPRRVHNDTRGQLLKLFDVGDLGPIGQGFGIRQVNHVVSNGLGTTRGFHVQLGDDAEIKLLTCLKGRIHDVLIDLRPHSPTRFQRHAFDLSEDTPAMLCIPKGFAHGYQNLSDTAELLYLHSNDYAPGTETGICPLSQGLEDIWPLAPVNISDRDMDLPPLQTWKDNEL